MFGARTLVDTLSLRRRETPAGRPRIPSQRATALAASVVAAFLCLTPASAQPQDAGELFKAVVKVATQIPVDARTARFLGTEREGSGVVIDGDGLILTIGYLILESSSAEVELADGRKVPARYIAYDHETGLGLLRASAPLGVTAAEMGDSDKLAEREQVVVVSHGGISQAMGAYVVSRREFAASWEYMLDNAIFTAPPHPQFGGAALFDGSGRLVGIGSLIVPDAAAENAALPGNMFVPVNVLKLVLGDLLASGRSSRTPRPWLGLYSEEVRGRLFVTRVPPGGPADAAGIAPGDLVLTIGGKPVSGLADYYRKMWSLGPAGVVVPLTVLRGVDPTPFEIKSIDRHDWLRRGPGY